MSGKDITVTTLEAKGPLVRLKYQPKPRNTAMWSAGLAIICGAGLMAFWRQFPGSTEMLAIAASILAVVVAGGAILIMRTPRLVSMTTDFDTDTRQIVIITLREGEREGRATLSFDDVTELRVLQQRGKGSQIETMSIVTWTGPQIVIAVERSDRAYSTKPYETPLKDMADRIAAETRLPRGKVLAGGLSAAAAAMGMTRS